MLQEAVVIILDIGHSVSQDTETIKSGFLENARQCVSMILKRKVRCIIIGESSGLEYHCFYVRVEETIGDCVEVKPWCLEVTEIRDQRA